MSDRTLSPVTKLLITAKNHISKPENWIQGEFELNGSYCSLGALFSAAGWDNDDDTRNDFELIPDVIRAEKVLDELAKEKFRIRTKKLPNETYYNVVDYNDDDERTHEEILAFFDEAINRTLVKENVDV